MAERTTGLFDLDAIKYICASVGQENSILARLKTTGEEFSFKTRTDMYGRSKKKVGGWLETYNIENGLELTQEDFDIEDVITPEPIENVLHTVKLSVEGAVKTSGVTNWKGFMGEGQSFRVDLSTLKEYKGTRKQPKPYHFDAVVDYIKTKYKPEIVTGIETDDRLVQIANDKTNYVLLVNDKDYKGCSVRVFDINKQDEGVIDCFGFGKLWLNDKGDPKGIGRLFKYYQIISQDDVDNYKANCFSDVSWGEKSAYKALLDAKTDAEAWKIMLDVFKKLYPEPKVITGWKGSEFEIDALYVFQEMTNLAHLHRWENDFINVKNVLTKLGINYDS